MHLRKLSTDPNFQFPDKDNRKQSIISLNTLNLEEMNEIQDGAMKHMDKMIEQTKRNHNLEDRNFELSNRNNELEVEVKELKMRLKEKESMENELSFQLSEMSRKMTLMTLEKESKILIESSNHEMEKINSMEGSTELLKKLESKDKEVDLLREKLMEQNRELKEKKFELLELNEELDKYKKIAYNLELHNDSYTDDRSKSELLEVIRGKIEEKVYWESYAETLLRVIMLHKPDLLNAETLRQVSLINFEERDNLLTATDLKNHRVTFLTEPV